MVICPSHRVHRRSWSLCHGRRWIQGEMECEFSRDAFERVQCVYQQLVNLKVTVE